MLRLYVKQLIKSAKQDIRFYQHHIHISNLRFSAIALIHVKSGSIVYPQSQKGIAK
jgi:hypothetical protein